MQKVKQSINYDATRPNSIVTYKASDKILSVNRDASYPREKNDRRIAGGHFFMSSYSPKHPNNESILTLAQIIKTVIFSAAEAELGDLYINFKESIPERHQLEEMGHK